MKVVDLNRLTLREVFELAHAGEILPSEAFAEMFRRKARFGDVGMELDWKPPEE